MLGRRTGKPGWKVFYLIALLLVLSLPTEAANLPRKAEKDFRSYKELGHFRAFGFARDSGGKTAWGWSYAQPSVDRAVSVALDYCEKNRKKHGLRKKCTIYALGDEVLPSGLSEAAMAQAGLAYRQQVETQTGPGSTMLADGDDFNAEVQRLERLLAQTRETQGQRDPAVATVLRDLARRYELAGRYGEAQARLERALSIQIEHLGERDPDTAWTLNSLGRVLAYQDRLAAAEGFLGRALRARKVAFGEAHATVADSLESIGWVNLRRGRVREAVSYYRDSLSLREQILGLEHSDVAWSLNSLGLAYTELRRYDLAERHLERALAIRERALGAEHPETARTLMNIGTLLAAQDRHDEAIKTLQRALSIREVVLGKSHPDVARTLQNLAAAYSKRGRHGEAEKFIRRAIDISKEALGESHFFLAGQVNQLASILRQAGRLEEAKAVFRQAIEIQERTEGIDNPLLARYQANLADLLLTLGREQEALDYARHATASPTAQALTQRRSLGFDDEARYDNVRNRNLLLLRVIEAQGVQTAKLADEAFRAAQRARASRTAETVAYMATRFAGGKDALARTVRQQQDLRDSWQALDAELEARAARPATDRDVAGEAKLRKERARVAQDLAVVVDELSETFPDYSEISNPRPLGLADVQALLQRDEALVSYLVAEERSYLWLVRRGDVQRFALDDFGYDQLEEEVFQLRRALDQADILSFADIEPFDPAAAHALYKRILAPTEPFLGGVRHLFVVPDKALESLPLGVLLTALPHTLKPDFNDYPKLPWLAKKYALSTLPAVSSLRALRRYAKTERRRDPFIGFGDPIFQGGAGASRAIGQARVYRGDLANVQVLRSLSPLPEAGTELKQMAAILNVGEGSLHLGAKATETAVKSIDLARYAGMAFATHGILAGELLDNREPALVLTPPETPTTLDDGLLTASEIAQLKLNADWVILSACNTAGPDGSPDGEGLSGLAKAFFYAGSRSLLVSHWPVWSDATAALTTRMLTAYVAEPSLGRAEALRRAMLALMQDESQFYFAHPMSWAPFVVVGEGGIP